MTETTQAREMFQSAYENRYTWDKNFPGFTADMQLVQGSETYTGSVRINPDLTVELSGIEDEAVYKSVQAQLKDVVTHRQSASFANVHGKNKFALGETDDSGAVEVHVSGAAMGSEYKVRDRVICYVQRVVGPMTFFIDTYETLDTGAGYVPTRYDLVMHNTKSGDLVQEVKFEDSYEAIGDYHIMTAQTTHTKKEGNTTTTSWSYSNVNLLEPSLV